LAQEAGNATFGLRTAFARTFDQQERADTILNSVKQIKDKNVLDPTNDECYPAKELFEKRWKIANKGKYKITSTILHPFSDDDKLSFTQTLNMLINSDYYKGSSYSETQDVIDTLKQSLKIYNENAPTPPTPNPPTPPTPNPPTPPTPNPPTPNPPTPPTLKKPSSNLIKIPSKLGDKTGVMNFQDWLDQNKPGWASGYQGGVVSKGRGYGSFGPRTQKAWALYGKEFLSGGKKQEPSIAPGVEGLVDDNNVSFEAQF
jgi:hypothetical protein